MSEFKIYRMKSVIYILDILETSYTFIDERKTSQNENLNLNNYFRLCQSLQTALFGLLVFSNGKDEMEIEEKLFFKQGKFTPNLHGFPEANFFWDMIYLFVYSLDTTLQPVQNTKQTQVPDTALRRSLEITCTLNKYSFRYVKKRGPSRTF